NSVDWPHIDTRGPTAAAAYRRGPGEPASSNTNCWRQFPDSWHLHGRCSAMQWKRWALWSIFVALAGCTSDSSTHFPGYGPPADQDFSYDGFQVDTTSGTTILDSTRVENPYDLVVSAGRLFVMEQYPPPVLRVFGLGTWQLEAEAGRRGEGPGEVMVPWRLFAAPNGDPWIFDMRQRRIVRYYRIDDSGALVPDEETISLQSG